ncbi:hypothetical protein DERF_004576 [Dermatophagoides farinae]|uniref:Uncharacterized protein n=1 Tax=Dermatophagoides farinae TaxID=6954 RepID=A0A922I417_DERFA|nr:hypothetical protein DERF_004576 [Dermatophagoides farinae]
MFCFTFIRFRSFIGLFQSIFQRKKNVQYNVGGSVAYIYDGLLSSPNCRPIEQRKKQKQNKKNRGET